MAVNMVLLGALLHEEALPLTTENVKTAIRTRTRKAFVETNLKAFDLGFEAAAGATKG
jgi:indolepyruvate ferredoxin oxidoreductase beta subunit